MTPVWHFVFVTDAHKIACGRAAQFYTNAVYRVTCPDCLSSPLLGTAPCGNTYGTAAGPNDGVTRCACGVVHPVVRLAVPFPEAGEQP